MKVETGEEYSGVEHDTAQVSAVVGATVIDGNGGAPIEDGVILIDGKRILAVGDRSIPLPPQAQRIEVTGKFITPGLMYPQVVLVPPYWPPEIVRDEQRYDEVAIEAAQLALKGGVTSLFEWVGPRDSMIKARNAINGGQATGARIFTCGHWLGSGGPFSSDMMDHGNEDVGSGSFESQRIEALAAVDAATKTRINTLWELNVGAQLISMPLKEARQAVRDYVRSGIDHVTYLVNSHRLGAYDLMVFSARVQRMIIEEAHEVGLPVQAFFATTEESVRVAVEAGADIISPYPYGFRPLSAETLELIAEKGTAVHIIAASTKEIEWYRQQPENALYPGVLKMFETVERDHRGMIQAGISIVSAGWTTMMGAEMEAIYRSATATPNIDQIGEGHITGLQALQDKGMTPMQALMAATRNVARAFKVDKDLGTLKRGKLADLVVWSKNPLENTEHYRCVHSVVKDGQPVDIKALPTQRVWTVAAS